MMIRQKSLKSKKKSRKTNNCKERSVIMRDATKEEYESVNNYIKSISTETGINFWDLIK